MKRQRGAALLLMAMFIFLMCTYPVGMHVQHQVELEHQRNAYIHYWLTHHAVVVNEPTMPGPPGTN